MQAIALGQTTQMSLCRRQYNQHVFLMHMESVCSLMLLWELFKSLQSLLTAKRLLLPLQKSDKTQGECYVDGLLMGVCVCVCSFQVTLELSTLTGDWQIDRLMAVKLFVSCSTFCSSC